MNRIITCLTFYLLSTLFLSTIFLFPTHAQESPLFSSTVESNYVLGPYTYASVDHTFSVTALQDEFFLTSYTLLTDNASILDAQAKMDEQLLPITFDESTMAVELPQSDKFVRNTAFTLRYKADEVVEKKGLLREIVIPFISSSDDMTVTAQDVRVNFPKTWGAIQSESVRASDVETTDEYMIRTYQITSPNTTELRIVSGDYQLYDVKLSYHLHNDSGHKGMYEVAFPPTFGEYQKVFIESISPEPDKIRFDQDGNFLGYYNLKKNESLDVLFTGQIKIDLIRDVAPSTDVATLGSRTVDFSKKIEDIPSYLIPDKYWEVNDPAITELATTLPTAQDVYSYVTTNFTYGTDRIAKGGITRYGAVEALKHTDSAVCMEFTDVMIALLRSNRIPAREVDGYAYIRPDDIEVQPTVNDVLHAWVQYYNPDEGWVNVDPTWGATTGRDYFNAFDNDHIIFAIKGVSSQRPDPAGVYKGNNFDRKDVDVRFADSSEVRFSSLGEWLDGYEYRQLPWWERLFIKIKSWFG